MCNEGIFEKELDVSNTDDFGAAVSPLGHFGVFAQPHHKEEREDLQMCDR